MPKYKFEEIAYNSTKKKKPEENDKYTYVGLEHLDSGTLKVSRWGSETAPIGEKLLMEKGDVLFGKRRAYQKKVGIAPFNGIFSAHGMVLRPREKVITKEFFPLFISSDYFLDEAIRISVGSLSPTVNWKDLKSLEFDLPTIEEQKRIAPIIWAAINTKNSYKRLIDETDKLVKSQFIEMFGDTLSKNNNYESVSLSTILDKPVSGEWGTEEDNNSGCNIIRTANFNDDGTISYDNLVRRNIVKEVVEKKRMRKGCILIEKSGGSNDKPVGRVVFFEKDFDVYLNNNFTAQLYVKNRFSLDPMYVFYFMFTNYWSNGTSLYEGKTTGIHNLRLNEYLENTYIPLPPLECQKEFISLKIQSDKSKFVVMKGKSK